MRLLVEGIFLCFLLAAAYTDVRTGKIPNIIPAAAAIWCVLVHVGKGIYLMQQYGSLLAGMYGSRAAFFYAAARDLMFGGAVTLVVLLPLYLMRVMGAGDVKLLVVVGMMRGWRSCLSCFLCIAFFAAAGSLILMLRKRILKERMAYFATYVKSVLLTKQWSPYVTEETMAACHLPLAVPVFLGTVLWTVLYGGVF